MCRNVIVAVTLHFISFGTHPNIRIHSPRQMFNGASFESYGFLQKSVFFFFDLATTKPGYDLYTVSMAVREDNAWPNRRITVFWFYYSRWILYGTFNKLHSWVINNKKDGRFDVNICMPWYPPLYANCPPFSSRWHQRPYFIRC